MFFFSFFSNNLPKNLDLTYSLVANAPVFFTLCSLKKSTVKSFLSDTIPLKVKESITKSCYLSLLSTPNGPGDGWIHTNLRFDALFQKKIFRQPLPKILNFVYFLVADAFWRKNNPRALSSPFSFYYLLSRLLPSYNQLSIF